MKKLLLTFSLAAMLLSAKAQIVVTGAMFDPQGGDAPAAGTLATGTSYVHKGGYEYIQLMATQNIDFALTPFSVVRCLNTGATTGAPVGGWSAAGITRTFKFNLTSGTVNKGEFFYVGGPEKTAGGFLVDGATYYPALDLSGSKWIRTIAYSDGTGASATPNVVGDDGIGIATEGLFANSTTAAAANPQGIAVFSGTAVNVSSVPIDVVFTGWINPITSTGSVYSASNGYRVSNTDRYTTGFYADNSGDGNKYAFLFQSSTNVGWFLKLGGVYNLDDNTWTTKRSASYVQLVPPSAFGTIAARTSFATLAMLEGNVAGYNGASIEATKLISPLPVQLTSFTAKANKQGAVNLAWSTASEKDNSHFEVTRSVNGVDFETLGQVKGNGNSDVVKNYSYTDTKPVVGANYYRLKQVDTDGKFALSGIEIAKVGLNSDNINVAVNATRTAISVTYNALSNGKALFNVYSISGAKVATVEKNVTAGVNQISIPATLSNSIHVLNVSQAGATASTKF